MKVVYSTETKDKKTPFSVVSELEDVINTAFEKKRPIEKIILSDYEWRCLKATQNIHSSFDCIYNDLGTHQATYCGIPIEVEVYDKRQEKE